jgi:CubicO group peptidase (beta-lactamase class C family)
MVATVIARLAEAGRLSLDDPAAAHVPELRGREWAERATLRDLLANRSGLPLSAALEFGFAARPEQDDEALSRLAAEVARAAPAGGPWSYSNVGWCLLGRAIETATGLGWEDAMRAQLGDVLRDASFAASPRAYGPAGTSLVTTAGDLLRFAALQLDDPSLAFLRETHADVSIRGWLDAWCLGWARFDWPDGPVWGWDGLIDDERSVLRLVPDRRAAVVLATHGSNGRALYRSLFAELLPAAFGIAFPPLRLDPAPDAAGDLERFAGVYAWPDRRVEVEATAAGLLIREGGDQVEAQPLDARTFLVDRTDPDNPTVTFGAFDEAGRPRVLYLMLWGLERVAG